MELILPHFTNNMTFYPFHKHFVSINWLDVSDVTTGTRETFSYVTNAQFQIVKRTLRFQKS